MARAVKRTLERRGHRVTSVATLAAARELLDQRFDAAILDIELPDGSGVTMAAELLGAETAPVVVFFSGVTDGETKARAADYGGVVAKGAGLHELLRAVEDALSERRALAAGAEHEGGEPRGSGSGPRRKLPTR